MTTKKRVPRKLKKKFKNWVKLKYDLRDEIFAINCKNLWVTFFNGKIKIS